MKRIEVHYIPNTFMDLGVYQILEGRSLLLATCLTEEIANEVKKALEL